MCDMNETEYSTGDTLLLSVLLKCMVFILCVCGKGAFNKHRHHTVVGIPSDSCFNDENEMIKTETEKKHTHMGRSVSSAASMHER